MCHLRIICRTSNGNNATMQAWSAFSYSILNGPLPGNVFLGWLRFLNALFGNLYQTPKNEKIPI